MVEVIQYYNVRFYLLLKDETGTGSSTRLMSRYRRSRERVSLRRRWRCF